MAENSSIGQCTIYTATGLQPSQGPTLAFSFGARSALCIIPTSVLLLWLSRRSFRCPPETSDRSLGQRRLAPEANGRVLAPSAFSQGPRGSILLGLARHQQT